MRRFTPLLLVLLISALPLAAATAPNGQFGPTTTNNNDSCDIALMPAATLPLPYFEVDFNTNQSNARTTLFTIQNTSPLPQIAHVVLWTDFGFPVIDFNLFLTGYDVQPINLYDIFARGVIAPGSGNTSGTSINTTVPSNPTVGSQPAANDANPHFLSTASTSCGNQPGQIPPALLTDLRATFTTGRSTGAWIVCSTPNAVLGSTHAEATGYVTIDVVATCSASLPTADYFANEILFDNVLTGDTMAVNPSPIAGNYAGGNPLVHIRAIPAGGKAGELVPTQLPYTFYDLYTPAGKRAIDRRQPLPSTFAPRYIQGGTGSFNTKFKIWREPMNPYPTSCSNYVLNSNMPIADTVRFDEHENATVLTSGPILWAPPPGAPGTVVSSSPAASSVLFPPLSTSGDVAGWMYLNLNNGGSPNYSTSTAHGSFGGAGTSTYSGMRQSQAWVVTSMSAEGRFSVDMDAVALGNGCSPSPAPGAQIAPAQNVTP